MAPSEGYLTMDDGLRLFYRTRGEGPATVIVPNGFYLGALEPLAEGRRLVLYDPRNRGLSDPLAGTSKEKAGIRQDVLDLEAVRRHLAVEVLDLVGHSYMGVTVILYAAHYPDHVNRVVQIGPLGPSPDREYPAHLTSADAVLRDVMARLARLQEERASLDPEELCRKAWSVLRPLYVADPAAADKIDWDRCDLPNERGFMQYWSQCLLPSIRDLHLTDRDLEAVRMPVLTVHGRKDRSAPYGGGREWALRLPNARLLTVENAGHAPWIEARETVFAAIGAFLDGAWPEGAEEVLRL